MLVILQNIRSLYNVGSIFRTADAVGAEKIYLCGITPTPFDRFGKVRQQFAKVSLGAEKSIAWEKRIKAADLIAKLKKEGYKILAVEQSKTSIPYHKFKTKVNKSKIALMMGNEIRGISKALLRKADKVLEIPMRGAMIRQAHHPRYQKTPGKESLNVAIAFAVIIFHLSHD